MSSDEDAIRNLLGRHAQLTDDGDVGARVSLYLDDGAFEMGGRRSSGHAELRTAFTETAARLKNGKHMTANMVIAVESDRATVQTDWTYMRVSTDGVEATAVGRYFDTLEKLRGMWLIRERRVVVAV